MRTIFLYFLPFIVIGQTPQFSWVHALAGQDYYSRVVRCDAMNNIYTLGFFSGTADLDPGPGTYTVSSQNVKAYIIKTDQQGHFMWGRVLGATPHDICFDTHGDLVITGYFTGNADMDPGPGQQLFTSTGPANIFVLKLDNNGIFKWAKQLPGDSYAEAWAIDADPLGNIVLTGYYNGHVDFDPGPAQYTLYQPGMVYTAAFVCKLDVSGTFQWVKSFGHTATMGTDICTDNSGNIYFTGEFADTVDFDPGPGTFILYQQQFQVFACKLSATGDYVWAGEFGGYAADMPGNILLDSKKNIYVSGYLKGVGDVDPGPGTVLLPQGPHWGPAFITKLDSSGHFISALGSGVAGGMLHAMAADTADNLYLTGMYIDSLDLDPGPATFSFTTKGGDDLFVTKLSSGGQLIWGGLMPGGVYHNGASIAVDRAANIFISGLFSDTVDFDPTPLVYSVVTGTVPSTFILKIGSGVLTNTNSSTVDVTESVRSAPGVYPNPCDGNLWINGTNTASVRLYDATGRKMNVIYDERTGHIYFGDTPAGSYLLEVRDGARITRRFIIKN